MANSIKGKTKVILLASRPLLWPAAPFSFLLGLDFSGADVTLLAMIQLLSLGFPLCLTAYGLNDVYDYKTDLRNPRKGMLQGPLLGPEHHSTVKKLALICAGAVLAVSMLTFDRANIAVISALLFLAYAYSAPPLKLKERPLLDSVTNGIGYFFLPFAAGATYGDWGVVSFPVTAFVAWAVMGLHAMGTVADYTPDREAGKMTFAVAFGKRTAAGFSALGFGTLLGWLAMNWPASVDALTARMFVFFCLAAALAVFIWPEEKNARICLKLYALSFIAAAAVYVLVKSRTFSFFA